MVISKLSHQAIVARQQHRRHGPRLPVQVVLNNIRSLYNVGSIFRTADGAGIMKIWLCGITGHPPNKQISKTALGAEETVAWEAAPDPVAVVRALRGQGYTIVVLEQMEAGVPYTAFCPRQPVCLVIGNEIEGVSPSLLPYADAAIEIEMAGLKNSLNVAVAFGIIAYHLRTHLK